MARKSSRQNIRLSSQPVAHPFPVVRLVILGVLAVGVLAAAVFTMRRPAAPLMVPWKSPDGYVDLERPVWLAPQAGNSGEAPFTYRFGAPLDTGDPASIPASILIVMARKDKLSALLQTPGITANSSPEEILRLVMQGKLDGAPRRVTVGAYSGSGGRITQSQANDQPSQTTEVWVVPFDQEHILVASVTTRSQDWNRVQSVADSMMASVRFNRDELMRVLDLAATATP